MLPVSTTEISDRNMRISRLRGFIACTAPVLTGLAHLRMVPVISVQASCQMKMCTAVAV
jgi:hypothetical protein